MLLIRYIEALARSLQTLIAASVIFLVVAMLEWPIASFTVTISSPLSSIEEAKVRRGHGAQTSPDRLQLFLVSKMW